jgi:DNA anti-recombination protein RmuC
VTVNPARLARNLIADGIDRALAEPLAEHLADEIERSVATREHVELVVTREVQQLRVEMHEEFRRFEARISDRLDTFQSDMTHRLDVFQTQMDQRMDTFQSQMTQRMDTFQAQMMQRMDAFQAQMTTFQAQITQRLDSQTRWLATSLIALFLAVLANLLKDVLL